MYAMKYSILLRHHLNLMSVLKASCCDVIYDQHDDCTVRAPRSIYDQDLIDRMDHALDVQAREIEFLQEHIKGLTGAMVAPMLGSPCQAKV